MLKLTFIRTYILGMLGCLCIPSVFGQDCKTLIDDFETNRYVTSYTVTSQGAVVQNQANPAPTSTVNGSSACAKYTPNTGVYETAVIVAKLNVIKNANLFRNGVISLNLDVYTGAAGTSGISAAFRKKGAPSTGTVGRHTIFQIDKMTSDKGWTNITFSANIFQIPDNTIFADSIAELEIQIPSYGNTIYFDNVAFVAKYSSIDNFDSERSFPALSYQGTLNAAFSNSSTNVSNSSSKCATFKKATGNGNAGIFYPIPAGTSVAKLKAGIDKLGISVYVPGTLFPIKVSLIDTNNPSKPVHSVYTGQGTKSADWNFVPLTYVSQASNVADGDVDVLFLEIDPGTVSTSLYRFDDFIVMANAPAAPSAITGSKGICTGPNPYTYSVPELNGVGYEWSLNGIGTISSGNNTAVIKAVFTSGAPSVNFRYTVDGGCSSPWLNVPLSIITQATSTVSLVSPSSPTVCANNYAMLSGTFTGADSAKWQSSGTGTFKKSNSLYLYYPSNDDGDLGLIDISYIPVGGNCPVKSGSLGLNILANPIIAVITPDMEVCTTATSVVVSASSNVSNKVNWYGTNTSGFSSPNPVNNGTSVTYTFLSTEKVLGSTIQLKAETDYAYQCGTGSKYVSIKFVSCVVTDVEEQSEGAVLRLSPNPSQDGRFSVNTKEEIEGVIVSNTLGQEETFLTKEFHTSFKGLLLVKIKTEHSQAVHRVVVE